MFSVIAMQLEEGQDAGRHVGQVVIINYTDIEQGAWLHIVFQTKDNYETSQEAIENAAQQFAEAMRAMFVQGGKSD